jgi:antitoxin (DNA-binding transcriptional repressor) of toxin-antitoxin stability system
MATASVEEVQAHLVELITKLRPGEELVITEHDRPIARLLPESTRVRNARRLGSAVGILKVCEEGDEHLEDFREYMP